MANVKRNDPCPCGSGKKYKKCCMNRQAAAASTTIRDEKDFQQFLPRVVEFSKPYEEELQNRIWNDVSELRVLGKSDQQAFVQSLSLWSLFNVPIVDERTIVQAFIDEHKHEYSEAFQTFLTQWERIRPGIYRAERIAGSTMTIVEQFDKAEIRIDMTGAAKQLSEGDVVIGYLYPTLSGYALGSDVMIIPDSFEALFFDEWERFWVYYCEEGRKSMRDVLTEHYPAALHILSGILTDKVQLISDDELSLTDWEIYDDFVAGMKGEPLPYSELLWARLVWTEFVEKKQPRITKQEVFSAALEYYVRQETDVEGMKLSQKKVADKYGVSPGTVSAKYKQLKELAQI
ncbi:SEC-C domain-containing protein [Alteribacter natronophilus]|uniref:SEC-C domain-containing protein n=1 Tax=Alteribacter natronophilus TaxID=2583810 RepID=UPI001AEDF2F4|nr:SEC-C domain-containing protein [Alteribacter natronophilus]